MGFTVKVVEESGPVLDEVVVDRNFNPVLKGIDRKRFPVMGTLDPYGDTSLNYLQCGLLLDELRDGKDLLEEAGVKDVTVSELVRLCGVTRAKPHRHLLFIGD